VNGIREKLAQQEVTKPQAVVAATRPRISTVILTFNSASTIGATLESVARVSNDVHVVDSFSTDATLDIAERAGARVVQHRFDSYAAQRNWAIDTLHLQSDWELHLDADERLSDQLAETIQLLMRDPPAGIDGYFIPRRVRFLGREIRHGGMYPIWHLRLFRRGKGRCENRRYDQHFYVDGETGTLAYPVIDDIQMSVGEFIARHNRWADAEVEEIIQPSAGAVVQGRLWGNPVERKRQLRSFYNRMPLFFRAFALFFYRYVLRRGFLDGYEGLIFFALQTLAYRLFVDAKLYERRRHTADTY
jgi:glycosyltransferase involved in cell wall biosynthesis